MGIVRNCVRSGQMQVDAKEGDVPVFTLVRGNSQSTDSAQTISAAAITGGFYKRTGLTADRTDTTATGALIDAAIPELNIGESFRLLVSNQVTNKILTLAGGVGVTLTSTTAAVPAASAKDVIFTKTGVATYDMYVT